MNAEEGWNVFVDTEFGFLHAQRGFEHYLRLNRWLKQRAPGENPRWEYADDLMARRLDSIVGKR